MVKVKFIPNLLDRKGRIEKQYPFDRRTRLEDYIRWFREDAKISLADTKVIFRGRPVKPHENVQIRKGDDIIIVAETRGPVVAAFVAVATFTATVTQVLIVASTILTAYSVYSALTASKPKMPDFGTLSVAGSMDSSSPTYGWDNIQSTQDVGVPIRILYGRHRIGGNIINQFIRTDGEKQYLNMLFGLCEGPVQSIGGLQINENPSANYDGIELVYRTGENDQALVPGFEDQHNANAQNVKLEKDDPYVYTTVGMDIEAFEVQVSLPTGLFAIDGNGGIGAWEVTYQIEYKIHTDVSYTDLGTITINDKTRTAIRRIFRKDGLTPEQYDIRITRTSDNSSLTPQREGDLYLTNVDEITTEDLSYPNLAIAAVKALATGQLSGATPNCTFLVEGLLVRVPLVLTEEGGDPVAWEDYYYDPASESYKLLADETELFWDGETYTTAYSANPVWCLRDLLTNTRYGLGEYIDTTQIDDDAFLEMARYSDERVSDGLGGYEKRFRFDVAIDSYASAIDIITQLTATFRAFAFYSGSTVKLVIDKPAEPVQIFGMGNIIKSSFTQSWKSLKEIPNIVEVQFNDADKNYDQEVVPVTDEVALQAGAQARKKSLRIYCTRITQAIREGRFALNVAKYINRFVTIKVGIDAIACQPGDIVGIAHDVPQWGASGRVQASSSTTLVKLDREVTILADQTYKIRVRFADDTIEERTVTDGPGTVSEVNVSPAFTNAPDDYDVYSFGIENIVVKPYRIIAFRRASNFEAEITAIEYNESIYDTDSIVKPETNYSALSRAIPPVTNLKLTERTTRLSDGSIQISIDVDFVKPSGLDFYVGVYERARVYLSDDGGASWQLKGETGGKSLSIESGIVKDTDYKVAVTSIDRRGAETTPGASPQQTITILGKLGFPSDVTSFRVNQSRDRILFSWSGISDRDLYGYEIRSGETWDVGTVINAQLKGTQYIANDLVLGTDQNYWIKAIDTSGNYSENATQAIISVNRIPFTNVIVNAEEEPGWTGTLSDLVESSGVLIHDTGELVGTYTTGTIDVGFLSSFKIGLDWLVSSGGDQTFDSDEDEEFDDSETKRFTGNEVSGAVGVEIRTSEDGISWTSWERWQAADYYCRYYELRVTLTRASLELDVELTYFHHYADLPDVDDRGRDEVTVAGDGCDIVFSKEFSQEPVVIISILSGDGVYWRFTGKDTDGFNIKLYDETGTAVTGDFEWHAQGV